VDRDWAAKVGAWSQARRGARFEIGDAVRTLAASTAKLELDDGSHLELRASTTLRFSATPPGSKAKGLDVQQGSVAVETPVPLQLITSFGTAVLSAGSRVQLEATDSGLKVQVLVGRAVLEPLGAPATPLEPGVAGLLGSAPASSAPSAARAEPEGFVEVVVKGGGARYAESSVAEWRSLPEGEHTLAPGAQLELPLAGMATLSRAGQTATAHGSGRFVLTSGPSLLRALGGGSVELGADVEERLEVPGGAIVTRPGARAQVSTTQRGTEVEVRVGDVQLAGKQPEALLAGQRGLLRSDGSTEVFGRGLTYADLVVNVGESLTVHDPKPPTVVRFVFGARCPQGGVVRLGAGPSKGSFAGGRGAVALALGPGAHGYELSCTQDGSRAATGQLIVQQDAGTKPVPRSAPATALSADGRNYTVLYQNQLPAISLRWPDAPTQGPYSLQVTGPRGVQSVPCAGPRHDFASGTLAEGTHRLIFRSGARTSPPTTVTVRFDAAAPRAFLQTPAEPAVPAGGRLALSGTALPGWSVVVDGRALPLDELNRFAGEAMMPSDLRAVALELRHPTRGTHVYLRRALGSATAPP